MYLERRTLVKKYSFDKPEEQYNIAVTKGNQPTHIDPNKVSMVIEEIMYWRKVNAIHNWFVQNVQDGEDDCGEYYISLTNIQSLLDIINTVLKDLTLAPKLLPTTSGFFFGGEEYDEYYFDQLKETQKVLTKLLEQKDVFTKSSLYYTSSW